MSAALEEKSFFFFWLAPASVRFLPCSSLRSPGRETREIIARTAADSREFPANKVTEGKQFVGETSRKVTDDFSSFVDRSKDAHRPSEGTVDGSVRGRQGRLQGRKGIRTVISEGNLESLLTLFVALTAIAVMTQAGVLVAIYMVSKRHSEQMERFMNETREIDGTHQDDHGEPAHGIRELR